MPDYLLHSHAADVARASALGARTLCERVRSIIAAHRRARERVSHTSRTRTRRERRAALRAASLAPPKFEGACDYLVAQGSGTTLAVAAGVGVACAGVGAFALYRGVHGAGESVAATVNAAFSRTSQAALETRGFFTDLVINSVLGVASVKEPLTALNDALAALVKEWNGDDAMVKRAVAVFASFTIFVVQTSRARTLVDVGLAAGQFIASVTAFGVSQITRVCTILASRVKDYVASLFQRAGQTIVLEPWNPQDGSGAGEGTAAQQAQGHDADDAATIGERHIEHADGGAQGQEDQSMLAGVISAMYDLVASLTVDKLPSINSRQFVQAVSVVKGCRDLVSIVAACWDQAMQLFSTYVLKVPYYPLAVKPHMDRVNEWMSDYDAFMETCPGSESGNDAAVYSTVLRLRDRASDIRASLRSDRDLVVYLADFNTAAARIDTLLADMHMFRRLAITRRRPVWLYFFGDPGCGKSTASDAAASCIAGRHGLDVAAARFHKVGSSEYWDGYNNQLIYAEDDVLLTQSLDDQSEFVRRAIDTANVVPLPLNMSYTLDKGKFTFTSEYMITTSNVDGPRAGTLVKNGEAFKRRIDFIIVPNRNGTVDPIAGYTYNIIGGTDEIGLPEPETPVTFEELMRLVFRLHDVRGRQLDAAKNTATAAAALGASLRSQGIFSAVRSVPDRFRAWSRAYRIRNAAEFYGDQWQESAQIYAELGFTGKPDDDAGVEARMRIICPLLRAREFGNDGHAFRAGGGNAVVCCTVDDTIRAALPDAWFDARDELAGSHGWMRGALLYVSLVAYPPSTKTATAHHDYEHVVREYHTRHGAPLYGELTFQRVWNDYIRAYAAPVAYAAAFITLLVKLYSYAQPRLTAAEPEIRAQDSGRAYLKRMEKLAARQAADEIYYNQYEAKMENERPTAVSYGRPGPARRIHAQSSDSGDDAVESVVTKSLVHLKFTYGETEIKLSGLVIAPGLVLTAKHVLAHCLDDSRTPTAGTLTVVKPGGSALSVAFDAVSWLGLSNKDFILIDFGEDCSFLRYRDLTRHFATSQDVAQRSISQLTALSFKTVKSTCVETTRIGDARRCAATQYVDQAGNQVRCAGTFTSHMPLRDGACGAPYLYSDVKAPRRIVGIHVAGGGSIAVGCIVTREDIYTAIGLEHAVEADVPRAEERTYAVDALALVSEAAGAIPSRQACRVNTSTKIIASPLQGVLKSVGIKCKYFPADLSGTPDRPAWRGALSRVLSARARIDDPDIEFAQRLFSLRVGTRDGSGFTPFQDAVDGLDDVTGLARETSPGYPYTLNGWPGGKVPYLYRDVDGRTAVEPVVLQEVELLFSMLAKGQPHGLGPRCVLALKDETLPMRDGAVKPARPIMPFSIGMAIVGTMLFGKFGAAMKATCTTGPFTLGINPHGPEWGALARRLARPNWRFMPTDTKGQDATIPVELQVAFAEAVNSFFPDDPPLVKSMRVAYARMCALAPIVAGDEEYERDGGNPSGSRITSLVSSFAQFSYNVIALRRELVRCGVDVTPEWLVTRYDIVCNGDDDIPALSPDIAMVDVARMAKDMLSLGITWTNSAKTGPPELLDSITDVKYLSRSFVCRDGYWYAPMDPEELYQPLFWTRKGATTVALAAECMLIEAAHHGRVFYERFASTVLDVFRDAGVSEFPRVHTWGHIFERMSSTGVVLTAVDGHVETYAQGALRQTDSFRAAFERIYGVEPVTARAHEFYGDKVATTGFLDVRREPLRAQAYGLGPGDNVGANDGATQGSAVVVNASIGDEEPVAEVAAAEPLDIYRGSNPYTHEPIMIGKDYTVAEFAWAMTDAANVPLLTLTFPKDLTDVPNVRQRLAFYRYLRADVVVSIRITASHFQSGKLIAAYLPCCSGDAAAFLDAARASNAPCGVISAASNESLEIRVPYGAPAQYIDWAAHTDGLCRLRIFVLDRLSSCSSGATAPANVAVTARFENVHVAGIRPVPSTLRAQGHGPTREQMRKTREGVVSGVASAVSTFSGALRSVPVIGPVASVAKTIADIVGGIAGGTGFDMPASLEGPNFAVLQSNRGMANCVGLSPAQSLATDPGWRMDTDPAYVAEADDSFSLSAIARCPSIATSFSINETHVSGDLVFSLRTGSRPPGASYQRVTNLQHALGFVHYWRGSINYRLSFSSYGMVRARLRLVWVADNAATSMAIEDTTECPNKTFDVIGDTEVTVSVPYLARTQWSSTIKYSNVTMPDETTGTLQLYVVNPIVDFDSAAQSTVSVQVWEAAGPDMQFAKISGDMMYAKDLTLAQAVGRMNLDDEAQIMGGGAITIDGGIAMSDIVDSLADIGHRFSYMRSVDFTSIAIHMISLPLVTSNVKCLAVRCASGFMFTRGHLRFLFDFDGAADIGKVAISTATHVAGLSYDDLVALGEATTIVNPKEDNNIQVEVPVYYPGTCGTWPHANPTAQQVSAIAPAPAVLYVASEKVGTSKCRVFLALGDDFIAGVFAGPPYQRRVSTPT